MTSPIRKILVPTDFSQLAVCSFRFATQLAERCGAAVVLLHVVEESGHYSMSSTGEVLRNVMDDVFTLKMMQKGRSRLAELVESNANAAIPVRYQVQAGNPAQVITEFVDNERIDLVVMGASSANWLDRLLIGSTTEQVVQKASCPVITLKCNIEKVSQLQHIVFALDPDEYQPLVVEELLKLQSLLGARLHVLLVNTPDAFESSKVSNDRLRHFAATYQLKDYDTHVYADVSVEAGLFGFAEEINADLLAFATHSQSRLLRVLSPHSQQNMINHAPRPVWTFNPLMATAKAEKEGDYKCEL
jgi:nucleotide-binding universal stress UspA family protein